MAADGGGRNSPYTAALLRYLEEPGLEVRFMFAGVRDEVLRTTGGKQKPFTYGSLSSKHVYLAGKGPSLPDEGSVDETPPPPPSGDAARAFEAAERLNTVAAYRIVVEGFPGSIYAKLAQAWIDKHEREPLVVAGGDAEDDAPPPPPPPPTPGPEAVEQGLELSSEAKRLVQMGLAAGHSPGAADGVFGPRTRGALRAWQEAKGLEGTGYLTREQSEGLAGLGREEAQRLRVAAEQRAREEAERREREAEARRLAAAERVRKAREAEERRKRARKPGDTFRDCPGCPEMVVVPEGRFRMGSTSGDADERPVHEVTVGYRLAVGVYEVTFGEWDACVSDGGCGGYRPDDEGWGRGRRPVMNVSWKDAQAYVRWLSRKTGEAYRLLSESEWEYVARAGTKTARYWWGDEIGRNRASCDGCGSRWDGKRTAPVGSFPASPFGLYDVHGNAGEWVEDCWNGSYDGAPRDGSAWSSGDCDDRVLRGGSWVNPPWDLRSASRDRFPTILGGDSYGFRVARTLTP